MNSQRVALGFLGDARVILADPGIDRQRRADFLALEQIEEAPHPDPHAVFVPAPIRHVGKMRHAGRRRQHLARHRLADIPDFEIDDGPEHDARAVRKLERRPVDDRRISRRARAAASVLRVIAFSDAFRFRHVPICRFVALFLPSAEPKSCQSWPAADRPYVGRRTYANFAAISVRFGLAITSALAAPNWHCSLRRMDHLWNQPAGDSIIFPAFEISPVNPAFCGHLSMPGSAVSKRCSARRSGASCCGKRRCASRTGRPAIRGGIGCNSFRAVRAETERRAGLLSPEDQVVQSMPDASPTKWHRAHVTWFFEQFLLRPYAERLSAVR